MTPDLRFPIGQFSWPESVSPEDRARYMDTIDSLPSRMRDAVSGLSEEQLNTPYRDGGWSVRQVVHHVPESHMNSYIRFKLALTEDNPVIKPYDEAAWARTPETNSEIDSSLRLLEALHQRWVLLLRGMSEADWKRAFRHPERGSMELDKTLALYAWHSNHHVAHVTSLRQRMKW